METILNHVCEIKASDKEAPEIFKWLCENHSDAPHTFFSSDLLTKDRNEIELYDVSITVKFKTLEGATAFKLRWMD